MSLKQLFEGGAATAKHGTQRASKTQIREVIDFVSEHTGLSEKVLEDSLAGSAENVWNGHQQDCGDINIIFEKLHLPENSHFLEKLEKVSLGYKHSIGLKAFCFAIPTSTHPVQLSLLSGNNKNWLKFAHSNPKNRGSNFSGVYRNLLIQAVVMADKEGGKNFHLKNDEGKTLARVERSFKNDVGLERLFKIAKRNSRIKDRVVWNVALEKTDAQGVKDFLRQLGRPDITFAEDADIIDEPNTIAKLFFKNDKLTADDLQTFEKVLTLVDKLPNKVDILEKFKDILTERELEIPEGI